MVCISRYTLSLINNCCSFWLSNSQIHSNEHISKSTRSWHWLSSRVYLTGIAAFSSVVFGENVICSEQPVLLNCCFIPTVSSASDYFLAFSITLLLPVQLNWHICQLSQSNIHPHPEPPTPVSRNRRYANSGQQWRQGNPLSCEAVWKNPQSWKKTKQNMSVLRRNRSASKGFSRQRNPLVWPLSFLPFSVYATYYSVGCHFHSNSTTLPASCKTSSWYCDFCCTLPLWIAHLGHLLQSLYKHHYLDLYSLMFQV